MKAIEKEAEEWLKNTSQFKSVKNGFIAGANSKTVDEMLLKAIELAKLKDLDGISLSENAILTKVKQEFL